MGGIKSESLLVLEGGRGAVVEEWRKLDLFWF